MRVLIAEEAPDGHRLYFVRLLAVEALARDQVVTLCLSPAVLASPEFAATLRGLPVDIVEEEQPTGPEALVRVSRAVNSDLTIVLDADRILISLARKAGWRGSGHLRLLMLRSRMPARGADRLHRIRVGAKRLLLARLALMRRVEVLHLVPPAADGRYGPHEVGDPVEWTASPSAVAEWRSRLGDDVFWFAVLGVVTERKNIPLVLRAVQEVRSRGEQVGVLVAGRIDSSVLEQIDLFRSSGVLRLEVEDRLLGEEELDAAVAAVDCVVLAHSNEGSSGILGKALSGGTRVLAAGAVSLRDACVAHPDGTIWSPLSVAGVSAAAAEMLKTSAPAPRAMRSNLAARLLGAAS